MGFPASDGVAVFNDMSELPAWEVDGYPNDPVDPIYDWVQRRENHVQARIH